MNFITYIERRAALTTLIRSQQLTYFALEIHALSTGKNLAHNSKLMSLSPFLDENKILRVGGRLSNSILSYSSKHPILLPNSHFTKLLFRYEHIRLLHAGPSNLLNSIRQRYWPLCGRSIARHVVHQCIACFRANPKSPNPPMGQLPSSRVIPAPPFYNTGVDYAGPFTLKTLPGRGGKLYKSYVALFVCLATKALHLELVTDLSTAAFIASLRRFVARRGKPVSLLSDNGTNFAGARRELDSIYQFLLTNAQSIVEAADAESISWKFIPARSPHFGGLWESGVRSVKSHLKRVIGNQAFTYEDFYTLLTQIEAILNSRPLTQLSTDPNDFSVLTPAHFLIGRPLVGTHVDTFSNTPISNVLRYKLVQTMANHFWNRWSREYLNTLQQKTKWTGTNQDAVKIDRLVLLIDDGLPSMRWRIGRIVELHPGADNVVRVVSIRTSNGIVKRALRRVCPLPLDDDVGVENAVL